MKHLPPKTLSARISDKVASIVGSWYFIIIQSLLLLLWIVYNLVNPTAFDPYPFILLNLVLSFQAAFTAPIIMMSQNRQSEVDRHNAEADYHINIKAEKEVALLHLKIDLLKDSEIKLLINLVKDLENSLRHK
jgi:uncharacterized membrane protein